MIHLKPFEPSDIPLLLDWIDTEEAMIQFAGPVFAWPLSREQLISHLSDAERRVYKVIAEDESKTIGISEIYPRSSVHGVISRVLIGDKAYRGKGIGKILIRRLVDIGFGELGYEAISLKVYDFNKAAIKTYQGVGFKVVENEHYETPVGDDVWTAKEMIIYKQEYS